MRTTITLFSLLFIFSCHSPIKKGGGPIKTENRNVSAFTSIDASDVVEIDFTTGTSTSVTVEGPTDFIPQILTEVKGGTLFISIDDDIIGLRDPIRIHIQSPELNNVKLSGACSILLKSPLNNPDFGMDLSGASSFKGTLYNTKTDIEMSGASMAEIGGITNELLAHTSGASSLNAEKLSAVFADIESSGASNSQVTVDSTLKAKASGGSEINYSGRPSKVEKTCSSGGSIEEK